MKNRFSQQLKHPNPWLLSIIGLFVLSPLSTMLIDLVAKKHIFKTLIDLTSAIGTGLSVFFNINVRLYIIIIISAVLFIFIYVVKKIGENSINEPAYIDYKSDSFPGKLTWQWNYSYNKGSKHYSIIDLQPLCPNCSTPLFINTSFGALEGHCPRCKKAVFGTMLNTHHQYNLDNPAEVEAIILDNIKRMIKQE